MNTVTIFPCQTLFCFVDFQWRFSVISWQKLYTTDTLILYCYCMWLGLFYDLSVCCISMRHRHWQLTLLDRRFQSKNQSVSLLWAPKSLPLPYTLSLSIRCSSVGRLLHQWRQPKSEKALTTGNFSSKYPDLRITRAYNYVRILFFQSGAWMLGNTAKRDYRESDSVYQRPCARFYGWLLSWICNNIFPKTKWGNDYLPESCQLDNKDVLKCQVFHSG